MPNEDSLRVWGGGAALAFGALMFLRGCFDYRRTGNAQALQVGILLLLFGAVLLLGALFRWW